MQVKQIETDNEVSNLKTNLASVNKKLDEAIAILQANQNVKPHQYSMGPYM